MRIPYFVNIINEINNSSIEIFVDRSPLLFDQVLAYIMDIFSPIECYSELDYYGIIYEKNKLVKSDIYIIKDILQEKTLDIKDKLSSIENEIANISAKLNNIKNTNNKILCQYDNCDNYVDDDNFLYCDNHTRCRNCWRKAHRDYDYICEDCR